MVADLDLAPGQYAGDLRVKGEIVVPREILQPTLANLATQLTKTRDAKVAFDAQTGNFVISGRRRLLWGLWNPPFKLTVKPTIQDGKLGFKVAGFEHPGPSLLVDTYFLNKVARCTTDKGYPTTYDKASRTFWVDADTVVHRWTHLSWRLHMDFSKTPFEVKSDGAGGLVVDMDGPPTDNPRANKAKIRLDEYAVKSVFNEAFGEHFDVQSIDMQAGKFKLHGKARSAVIDGIAGLFALLAIAGGQNPNIGDTRVSATVEVEQVGDKLRIRPDMGGQKVINKIVEAMRGRGLPAEAREGYAELPAADILKKYDIARMELTPAGLLIEAETEPAKVAHPR